MYKSCRGLQQYLASPSEVGAKLRKSLYIWAKQIVSQQNIHEFFDVLSLICVIFATLNLDLWHCDISDMNFGWVLY
jgi:adenylosuccinate lyase